MLINKYLSYKNIEKGIRILIAAIIFVYGAAKSFQFDSSKLDYLLIKDATKFEIMWAFFGATKIYPIIIGVLQVIGSILLVIDKTKLVGSVLLIPIFTNIILLDIIYDVPTGALINALIIQIFLFYVCFEQRIRIIGAIKILCEDNKGLKESNNILVSLGIAILLGLMFLTIFNGN